MAEPTHLHIPHLTLPHHLIITSIPPSLYLSSSNSDIYNPDLLMPIRIQTPFASTRNIPAGKTHVSKYPASNRYNHIPSPISNQLQTLRQNIPISEKGQKLFSTAPAPGWIGFHDDDDDDAEKSPTAWTFLCCEGYPYFLLCIELTKKERELRI